MENTTKTPIKKYHKNIDSTGLTLLYYLLQLLIIHVMLLGFNIQPSLKRMYTGFNIDGILTSLLYFITYFKLAFIQSYIIVIILLLVPFAVVLAVQFLQIFLYVYALVTFIYCLVNYFGYLKYKSKIDISKYVIIKVGAPGTGKSSSGLWQAVEMSKKLWKELQYKYYILRRDMERYSNKGIKPPLEAIKSWNEIRTAYEFYSSNDCVPCLFTNIPLEVDGKFTNVLTYAHAEQSKRIPANTMLFFDEIGSVFPVDSYRDKPLSVSAFFRLCRHFGDFRILATEQDSENVFIDVRRVVADNEQMIKQVWALKPVLLVFMFKLLKFVFMLKPHKLGFLVPPLKFLSKITRYLGFRRFHAVSTGNTENAYNEGMKKRVYSLPTMLNCTYDDRTYRELYSAKNKTIAPDIFKSLILPKCVKPPKEM